MCECIINNVICDYVPMTRRDHYEQAVLHWSSQRAADTCRSPEETLYSVKKYVHFDFSSYTTLLPAAVQLIQTLVFW